MNMTTWKSDIWRQFGAAIDMLENAIQACPEALWRDRSREPEFWYLAFHTLFWSDLYLSKSAEGFAPPAPFTLSELDPAGLLPERVYSKVELQSYLEHCRKKCRERIESLKEEGAKKRFKIGRVDLAVSELLLYNMRHVQHHAAQLNLLLRQATGSAPRYIIQAKTKLNAE